MKNTILALLLIAIAGKASAQSTFDFTGKWKVQQEIEFSDYWKLIKVKEDVPDQRDWGKFLEFYADSSYTEYASAPCGLDDNHYRYSGKWVYQHEMKTIELSDIKILNDRPNIYMDYTVHSSGKIKVLMLKKSEIHIQLINKWEEVKEKIQVKPAY